MIGAALIVKNEEKNIERALNSLLPVCSQVIVVDTGSGDSTPSICQRLGAELHFHKWSDDFSEARNYALQFMRTEWIIVLDADEELDIASFNENLKLMQNKSIGGIRVKIINYLEHSENSPASEHTYPRIFRNMDTIRYEGTIHEQISSSIIEAGLDIVDSDILIRHFGYIHTSKEKIGRNKLLLAIDLEKEPDNGWLKFHLAEAEFADGEYDTAKKLFLESLETMDLSEEQKEKIYLRLAQIAIYDENFYEAHNFTSFVSNDINREGFRLYLLAAALMLEHKFEEALNIIELPLVTLSSLVDKDQVEIMKESLRRIIN